MRWIATGVAVAAGLANVAMRQPVSAPAATAQMS